MSQFGRGGGAEEEGGEGECGKGEKWDESEGDRKREGEK